MQIRPMQTEEEIKGKAYVHWKSWQEAYADLLPQDFLQKIYTLERCQDWASRYPQNILVALVDEQVVGFACYGASSQEDLQEAGERSTPFTFWRTTTARGLATSLCRRLWENCRAISVFPSGCWRGICVPFPSMKR